MNKNSDIKVINGWTLYDNSSAGAPSSSGSEGTRLKVIFTDHSDALIASLQQYKGGMDYEIRPINHSINLDLQKELGNCYPTYTLQQATVLETDLKSVMPKSSIVNPQDVDKMVNLGAQISNVQIQVYENLAEYSPDGSKIISRKEVQEKITSLKQSKVSRGKKNPRDERDEELLQKYQTALAHFDAGNVPGYNPVT